MNTTLLRKIKGLIRREAAHFDMGNYLSYQPGCDTTACIAGWACVIIKKPELGIHKYEDALEHLATTRAISPFSTALNALDLDFDQGQRLFYTEGSGARWPDALAERYHRAKAQNKHEEAAEVACERIDLFIRTQGEV